MDRKFDELEERIKKMERHYDDRCLMLELLIKDNFNDSDSKKPHKCPICDGIGKNYIDPARLMSGFEMMLGKKDMVGRSYLDCNSCEGKGIVWG